MLIFSDTLSFFHQHRAVTLMLEFVWISSVDGYDRTVYMQLSHKRTMRTKFRSECTRTTFPQPEQSNQNILSWIFVGNKSLPPLIGSIVSADQFNIFRLDLKMYFLYSCLSSSHVSARDIHLFHTGQSQFPQITFFDSGSYQRHRNISLYTVDSYPRWNQCQHFGHYVHQIVRVIVFVFTVFPQFIQACPPDYQSGVYLHTVWSECRIFKKLSETFKISLHTHVRQIRHHMSYHFVGAVFSQCKCFLHCLNSMPPICISCDIFVYTLDTNLQSGASITEEIRQMSFATKIWACLDSYSNTFSSALLREKNGLVMVS